MHIRLFTCALLILPIILFAEAQPKLRISRAYRDAAQARIDEKYAVIIKKDGGKLLVPISSLKPDDLAWLKQLSRNNTVVRGNSSLKVVAAETLKTKRPPKQTIQISEIKNGIETVQLCPPNVFRDQIGGTCMLYARVHWLDIAGYYARQPDIYKIINGTPPNSPWESQRYVNGLTTIITDHKPNPEIYKALAYGNNFEWAREQLRKGRPILAAFPSEIWQALPSKFIAERIWSGGSIGHQIVVNGFTYDPVKKTGTFHIINSWSELQEFDLHLRDARGGKIVFEHSMEPYGHTPEIVTKEIVTSIKLLKTIGKSNLYKVTTNRGVKRIIAPDERAVRRLVEDDS